VLYLMAEKKMSAREISDLLYKDAGLKGMSGLTNDMRLLEKSNDKAAMDAVDYFVSRLRREIGGLAAALGGLDCLVFTGGIGENSWRIRDAATSDMEWMGIELDPIANGRGDRIISDEGSRVTVMVLETDEERMIAEHTAEILGLLHLAEGASA
jgi:acetate kinase